MQSDSINFDDTKTAFAYKSTKELSKSRFIFSSMGKPWLVNLGTRLTNFALDLRLPVKGLIKSTLFDQFCGGESIEDCQSIIENLGIRNVHTILDYSVEGLKNEDGFEKVKQEAIKGIEFARKAKNIPFCIIKLSSLASAELMTKAQANEHLSEMEKTKLYNCEKRVDEIVGKIRETGLKLMIDAEESWYQNFVDGVAHKMMKKYNKEHPVVYNTYQMYRHDTILRLEQMLIDAHQLGYNLGAKLVRGAYMEKENDRAQEKGYVSPIHNSKLEVDSDFDKAISLCIDNINKMGFCIGSHNETSTLKTVKLMEEKNIHNKDNRIYFAQLLGMSDNISFKLASQGYNVAKYVPYGPVEKVLPYLFRRAVENTSISGQSGRELTLIKKEIKRREKEK